MDVSERAVSALTTPSSHFKGIGLLYSWLPILVGEDVPAVSAHVRIVGLVYT